MPVSPLEPAPDLGSSVMAGETGIFIGSAGDVRQELVLRRANRHGLIAGATGTGKTVTLQVLAEGFSRAGVPVFVSDVIGEQGHPIRATISEMGPLLLARLLDLNETQEGVLNVVFHVADEEGLLLLDLDDLQAMLAHCAERAGELSTQFGNITKASV